MSLVSIKRRTIIVWKHPRVGTLPTGPYDEIDFVRNLRAGIAHGWKLLYLVRCKPRKRRRAPA